MILSNVVIVLCRPDEPGNIGAACRAMKNMGLSRLRVVTDSPPEPLAEQTLLARAVHACDVWENREVFGSLADATADCSLVIGTTRRRGRKRKNTTVDPETLVQWLASGKFKTNSEGNVAFVFGNERTGLEKEELNLCNIASHIPVSDDFPSLNLSHAVQVYAYELFLAFGRQNDKPIKGAWVHLARPAVDELTAEITGTLAGLGFYMKPGREEQTRFLRDMICRAGLTESEGNYLKDIFIKTACLAVKGT